MSSSSTPRTYPMSESEYAQSTRPSSVAPSPAESAMSSGDDEKVEDVKKENSETIEELPEQVKYLEDMDAGQRFERLQSLLDKSQKYSEILHKQMSLVKAKSKVKVNQKKGRGRPPKGRGGGGEAPLKKIKTRVESDEEEDMPSVKHEEEESFQQSFLITGGTLKGYQLEGVAWMATLWENGISGILADEMGLGKTLQTIAFCAFLRERSAAPFLVVCPLSVLHNWIDEFQRFAPRIPTVFYHGTPEHRAELRRTVMNPKNHSVDDIDKRPPVIVTTYDIIIRDRRALEKTRWGYIVVDEGHRLKNMNCKLMQEIKRYPSAGRMILTGTPLHNNLSELWSLLNFVLPDIFSDLDTFQQWFNIPTMNSHLTSQQTTKVVTTLHSILKPFLLRRLKVDVEYGLPPKKEYVLYAPLTEQQKRIYEAVLSRSLRNLLIDGQEHEKEKKEAEERKKKDLERMLTEDRQLRKRGQKRYYDVDGSDRNYFKKLESGELDKFAPENRFKKEKSSLELGKEYHQRKAETRVNNMHLQNAVMQLRKVCSHPFLFNWPIDAHTGEEIVNDELIDASGKMLVLNRLLEELFKRGHKVLIFSQFTTMLNIIESWAIEFKNWEVCRIDGSTKPLDRREEMQRFQNGGDDPKAPKLFLLSTRAGGLGINLTAADTVIFYDQDWNPQMDMQAQDRAHRIGQTKPVLIFRIVTAHTIENTIMQRANQKRRLEALVIAKGKFKLPGSIAAKSASSSNKETLAEIAQEMLKLEGEKIDVVPNTEAGKTNVISDKDLDMLLDRSPAVFADRTKGWTSSGARAEIKVEGKGDAKGVEKRSAFAVYEAAADEGNDALANMLGEDIENVEEDADE